MDSRKLDFNKYDKYGQMLKPGDVVVFLSRKDAKWDRSLLFGVYQGDTKGNKSTGTYGRFITKEGVRSIKYTSVVFVFDPTSLRRAKTEEVVQITNKFYGVER